MTTVATGKYLARLREEAGIKQSELAKKITWSGAVLSRVESGERPVSLDELGAILEAIGTENASEFRESAGRVWQVLPKPPFGHSDEQLLWKAEEALRGVSELAQNEHIKHAFGRRLSEYESEIINAARLVLRREHGIAFVGDIGVGKTTAICGVTGLMVQNNKKATPDPVLEVGAGGITVCDVHVVQGPQYGLLVEPRSDDEIRREVREFARFLKSPDEPSQEDVGQDLDFNGTTKELERAIRNMSGLTRRRVTNADGSRTVVDPAKELADKSPDIDAMVVEILAKMDLNQRTRRELWHSAAIGKETSVWLAETFREINNGRHREFSIPQRIDIMVPQRVLGEEAFSIRLIDTRGIDGTAQRADIEAHFSEPHTLVVLCSNFNSAPATSVQQLIERAIQGQLTPEMNVKVSVLVLPKYNEALAVKDDQGYTVETKEDGYELKGDQAKMKLSNLAPDMSISFFDLMNDGTDELRDTLLELVRKLREKYCKDLEQLIDDANELVTNYEKEQVREIQREAAKRLMVWQRSNQQMTASLDQLTEGFLGVLESIHPSSLRASVRRQGVWYNLDYSHELGFRARSMVAKALRSKTKDFKAVAKNLLDDPDMEDAHGLVREADRIIQSGAEDMRQKVRLWGAGIHAQGMVRDDTLWPKCEDEWGQGPGYRGRVSNHHKGWFDAHLSKYEADVQLLLQKEWHRTLTRLADILTED